MMYKFEEWQGLLDRQTFLQNSATTIQQNIDDGIALKKKGILFNISKLRRKLQKYDPKTFVSTHKKLLSKSLIEKGSPPDEAEYIRNSTKISTQNLSIPASAIAYFFHKSNRSDKYSRSNSKELFDKLMALKQQDKLDETCNEDFKELNEAKARYDNQSYHHDDPTG